MSCIMGWNKRLELLTPSATNLCATNCANSTTAFLVYRFFSKKSIVFCKKLNNTKQKNICTVILKKTFLFYLWQINYLWYNLIVLEDCQSGRMCLSRKQVWSNPPQVQILYLPPGLHTLCSFFIYIISP